MKKYDTIIIGAGLAGCTLGFLLKKENKEVLIVEKQNIKTKNKLCGGIVTKKSYDLLIKIYGNSSIKKLKFKKYQEVKIANKDTFLCIENTNIYTIHRKELDDFVLDNYLKLGGEIIDNTTYDQINLKEKTLMVNGQKYLFDNVVGADGVFSKLRFDVTKRNQTNNFAMEMTTTNKINKLCIEFLDNFKGYGWIIPNNKETQIGIGNVFGESKIDEDFDKYLDHLKINQTKKRGAFLPTGNDIYLSYKNAFFIGDSSGLIFPITGEGIYLALYSAYKLKETMNQDYIKKMKPITKRIKKELFMLKFVYNDRIRAFLFKRYKSSLIINKLINKFIEEIL